MAEKPSGSCACGETQWEINSPTDQWKVCYCHCRNCRLVTGGVFITGALVPRDSFEITKGKEKIIEYKCSPEKFHAYKCGSCFSPVYQRPVEIPVVNVYITCFKENNCKTPSNPYKPTFHVNYENRVVDFPDDLPKFLNFPAEFGGDGKMFE